MMAWGAPPFPALRLEARRHRVLTGPSGFFRSSPAAPHGRGQLRFPPGEDVQIVEDHVQDAGGRLTPGEAPVVLEIVHGDAEQSAKSPSNCSGGIQPPLPAWHNSFSFTSPLPHTSPAAMRR